MTELREVRILVGKRSYRVQTILDERTLDRVIALTREVADGIGPGMEQENVLFFTCLQLAYSLEKIERKLDSTLQELERSGILPPEDEDPEPT